MKLTKIIVPDGSEIYIQYDEDEIDRGLEAVSDDDITDDERTKRFKKGLESNIRNYSSMVMESVKNSVDKENSSSLKSIELEFGLQIGGEAGIPFITKGTVQSNLNVKVAWEFKWVDSTHKGIPCVKILASKPESSIKTS